ncbi:MAG: helix-turn-helix transcriptional regulator [Bauldia sp.]|nr:helix-turn-helix transcriptional regulator [Bauldia sp.]
MDQTFDRVAEAIDAAYGAARRAVPWETLLRLLTSVFPGTKVAIASEDSQRRINIGMIHLGYPEDLIQSYVEYYSHINPWVPVVARISPFEAAVSDEIYPSDLFRDHEFYRGFIEAAGDAESSAGIKLFHDAHSFAMLSLHYGRRFAEKYNRSIPRFLTTLAPHLRNAIELSAAIEIAERSPRNLADMVEQMPMAAFLLDRSGEVQVANDAAQSLLDERAFAAMNARRQLRLTDKAAQLRLTNILKAQDVLSPASPGEIHVSGGTWRFLEFTSPRSDPRLIWLPGGEKWVVAIFEPSQHGASVRRQANAFGLTQQETRILSLLAEGRRVDGIASALGVSVATVRQHLKAIFAKTNTHRQADLIAKVLQPPD